MGRKTVDGIKWNRTLTDAEKEKLRYYSYDDHKMYSVAKDMGLKPDEEWLRKVNKVLRWWAKSF